MIEWWHATAKDDDDDEEVRLRKVMREAIEEGKRVELNVCDYFSFI